MPELIVKICIAAAVVLCALIILLVAIKIKTAVESTLILRNDKRDESIVWKLLNANYSSAHIMRRVIFPYNLSPQSKLFRIDAVNVNHGGVLLITIKNFHGMIENPFHGDWRQFSGKSITQLPNPLEQNARYSRALYAQFKAEEISNFPILSLVVYLDSKTRFKNRIEQIILVDRLTTYIHDMDKNRFLSTTEIKKVTTALHKFARHPSKSQLQAGIQNGPRTDSGLFTKADLDKTPPRQTRPQNRN